MCRKYNPSRQSGRLVSVPASRIMLRRRRGLANSASTVAARPGRLLAQPAICRGWSEKSAVSAAEKNADNAPKTNIRSRIRTADMNKEKTKDEA